jgi:hypothetical protein
MLHTLTSISLVSHPTASRADLIHPSDMAFVNVIVGASSAFWRSD